MNLKLESVAIPDMSKYFLKPRIEFNFTDGTKLSVMVDDDAEESARNLINFGHKILELCEEKRRKIL